MRCISKRNLSAAVIDCDVESLPILIRLREIEAFLGSLFVFIVLVLLLLIFIQIRRHVRKSRSFFIQEEEDSSETGTRWT